MTRPWAGAGRGRQIILLRATFRRPVSPPSGVPVPHPVLEGAAALRERRSRRWSSGWAITPSACHFPELPVSRGGREMTGECAWCWSGTASRRGTPRSRYQGPGGLGADRRAAVRTGRGGGGGAGGPVRHRRPGARQRPAAGQGTPPRAYASQVGVAGPGRTPGCVRSDVGYWTRTHLRRGRRRAHPETTRRPFERGVDVRRGGGETFAELRERVWAALDRSRGRWSARAPWWRSPTAARSGWPPRPRCACPSPGHPQLRAAGAHCSLTVIDYAARSGGTTLVAYNVADAPGPRRPRGRPEMRRWHADQFVHLRRFMTYNLWGDGRLERRESAIRELLTTRPPDLPLATQELRPRSRAVVDAATARPRRVRRQLPGHGHCRATCGGATSCSTYLEHGARDVGILDEHRAGCSGCGCAPGPEGARSWSSPPRT